MKHTLTALLLFIATFLQAKVIFHTDFEQEASDQFRGMTLENQKAGQGNVCAHLIYPPKVANDQIISTCPKLIQVEPSSWYRLTFLERNNIALGEVTIGVHESKSPDKMDADYFNWQWYSVSLNNTDWTKYQWEFQTAATTKSLQIVIVTHNSGIGSSWWDDITLESIAKQKAPLTILPFDCAVTFTDIPTRQAYTVLPEGRSFAIERDRRWYAKNHIRTLDIANATISIEYNDLPKDAILHAEICRGPKVVFTEEKPASMTGTAQFNIHLPKLEPGKYVFFVTALQNGKELYSQTKDIWRIRQKDIQVPKLEPINSVTVANGQRLVNGKPFQFNHLSKSPSWGYFEHHRSFCKPNVETHLQFLQEQFGQNLVGDSTWRSGRAEDTDKFVEHVIKEYRAYMDLAWKNNLYCELAFSYHWEGHGRKLDYDAIRKIVRACKDHPALFQWTLDEPEISKTSPEDILRAYQIIHEEDPNHIVDINLCQIENFERYALGTDVASFDFYPFPGNSLKPYQKRANIIAKANIGKPYESYLQCFNFMSLPMPTFDQLQAEFILDRIYGSHSLLCYSYGEYRKSLLYDPELQSYYRALVYMFRKLDPVLSPDAIIRDFPFECNKQNVCALALRNGDETIILVVNLSKDIPEPFAFTTSAQNVYDFMDDAWTFPVKKGKVSFTLSPLESYVFRCK